MNRAFPTLTMNCPRCGWPMFRTIYDGEYECICGYMEYAGVDDKLIASLMAERNHEEVHYPRGCNPNSRIGLEKGWQVIQRERDEKGKYVVRN